ncbi:putative glycoside hydrolase family 3 [Rosellinia necatrix]|uniref:Putative glycoside hydrolase family 3 n=1 Tax=Rosellinia necatrix TaxID=77044 RepID=A0A1W2THL0_ROSNE|nr:putative glycoside hydrolase family 3 [Rosellinia necatrix]
MISGQSVLTLENRGGPRQPQVAVVRDTQDCIPLTKILEQGDIVLLLTPVVTPYEQNGIDPFEPFGKALASRHSWIRHVPYTSRNGITNTHVSFIKRAKAVIFVISGSPSPGQLPQAEIAEASRSTEGSRVHIIITCGTFHGLSTASFSANFRTIVQLSGYSSLDLGVAAAVLFGESTGASTSGVKVQELIMAPRHWPPEEWDGRDVSPVYELWNNSLPNQFRLEKFPLQNLLQRDGYSMHFVVRLPETHEIIGFCATYTTFVDKAGERLIGSLAMIIVKSPYRRRGVGRSLYDHAIDRLKRIRGVDRLRLGSTYPRLLSGIPAGFSSEEWFRRRGWFIDRVAPGRGQYVCDWLLKIEDWPNGGFSTVPSGLVFRQATFDDFQPVLDFIEKETAHKDYTGWYDQYMNLAHDGRVNDIVLGLDRSRIIAAGLVYTTHDGSPLALDLPWARTIGPDVGGVSCICIADDNEAMTSSKDTVMIRLLDACIAVLRDHGMRRVYLDAIKGGDEGFQSMGFQKWATYSEVWQQT